jgi:hypothetical protein
MRAWTSSQPAGDTGPAVEDTVLAVEDTVPAVEWDVCDAVLATFLCCCIPITVDLSGERVTSNLITTPMPG